MVPLKAKFYGEVRLGNLKPQQSTQFSAKSKGGVAGIAKAEPT